MQIKIKMLLFVLKIQQNVNLEKTKLLQAKQLHVTKLVKKLTNVKLLLNQQLITL